MRSTRFRSVLAALAIAALSACGSTAPSAPSAPAGPTAPDAPQGPAATGIVVSLSPLAAVADACQAVDFSAVVTGTASQAVAWAVREGDAGGTITSGGSYTAPATAGTYHVTATSTADPTKSIEGTITVGPEKVLSVSVTPGDTSVVPGGALAFSATVVTSCRTFAAQ
jgi:uncharacterized cupin superfamily protein